MNAHEILENLRDKERREPGNIVVLPNVEFDHGSLKDQLWEESAMLPTNAEGNGEDDWAAWVSCRPATEYHEDWFEFEILEHVGNGGFAYRKVRQETSKHVRPEDYELIASQRKDLHLDLPVVYLDNDSWRWGIQGGENEGQLELFYQERTMTDPWSKIEVLPHAIDFPFWNNIKLVVPKIFELIEVWEEGMDCNITLIEENGWDYCLCIRTDSDLPGALKLVYQEMGKDKGELPGAFDKEDWARLVVAVDQFFADLQS